MTDLDGGGGRPRTGRGQNLSNIASQTGGKFYAVNNANALPRIYQREARRVSRSLVYEPGSDLRLEVPSCARDSQRHRRPAADHRFRAHQPQGEPAGRNPAGLAEAAGRQNDTILAGLALRAGQGGGLHHRRRHPLDEELARRAAYDKLFGQMVRWAMRPAGGTEKFTTATEVVDGKSAWSSTPWTRTTSSSISWA